MTPDDDVDMTDDPSRIFEDPTRASELRAKSVRACERAVDASLDADPSDVDRLRLGLDAAQMLLMIFPTVWHRYGYGREGVDAVAARMGFGNMHPPPPYPPPPPYTFGTDMAFMNTETSRTVGIVAAGPTSEWEFFPEHPARKDGLASGQSVTQDDLNLTSKEPSDWLLGSDDAGDDQQ